jgi:ComEC/Rec2-related protein
MAALVALLLATRHNEKLQDRNDLAARLAQKGEVSLSGTIVASNRSGLVRRAFQTDTGGLVNLVRLPPQYVTGQRLTVAGLPVIEKERRNPSGFDFRKALVDRGFAGSLEVLATREEGWSYGFARLRGWSESARRYLAGRVTSGLPEGADAQLIQAVVLGEKSQGGHFLEDFRKTGTMHIFAVSGLHVGLVALIAFGVARMLRLPPKVAIVFVIIAMCGYALVTGLRPPALRAALMGTILLSSYLLLRQATAVNNLLAAALVVLFLDSFQLWQIGFQLSFLVVGIIFFLEPIFWRKVEFLTEQDAYLPKALWTRWQEFSTIARTKIVRMFTVSSAAWLGSAPLSVFYFGWFTPIACIASVLMVAFAFLILTFAFLGLALGSLHPAAGNAVNWGNAHLASFARYSASGMSHWPGAWTRVHRPARWKDGLCVFDIRFGGGAIHLDAGGGVLLDGASDFDYWYTIQPALDEVGLGCDSLVASHADAMHAGGLQAALEETTIQQILLPEFEEAGSMASLRAAANSQQIPLIPARRGQIHTIADATSLEVLSAGDSTYSLADDRGLVVLIHHHGWRILYTADAGYPTERALLDSKQDLSADLWICGRNTANSFGHDAFVNAVSPRAVIATERNYPTTEGLSPAWKNWLASRGIIMMSQRDHGAVFVRPQGDELVLESFLTKEEFTLSR